MGSNCPTCGTWFKWSRPSKPQECCSRACAVRKPGRPKSGPKPADRPMCVCEHCGRDFQKPKPSRGGRYCSRACAGHAKGKGGVYIAKDGRARVHLRGPNAKQTYARCLMEGLLGRHLEPWEHVHHIDGDKTNDVIENLAVMSARDHALHHSDDRQAARSLKTHCAHGHEYSPVNTYVNPEGYRTCRTCTRERHRAKRQAQSILRAQTNSR